MSLNREPADRLTLREVNDELERLASTAADMARVVAIATYYAQGLRRLNHEDLLQEAFAKLLAGERVWPQGLPARAVLQRVHHSIASNHRTKADYLLAEDAGRGDSEEAAFAGDVTAQMRRTAPGPERAVEAGAELDALAEAVRGDEEVELLVEAWGDGLRGRDAMRELGWDAKTHDAARKRLIRRLNGLATNRRLQ